MPANGEERKIELIGTSGTPSPTVESKKIPADRDVEDAVPYRISEKISANRNVGDAVPYGKTEKISANRDVGDAVPYGKTEKMSGGSVQIVFFLKNQPVNGISQIIFIMMPAFNPFPNFGG